jgi:glycogen debranching enzyme
MTVKITVGPPVLTINKGSTFMVTDYGGEITPTAAQGVFADDTRFVSSYRLWIDGQPWQRVSSAAVMYHTMRLFLTNPEIRRSDLQAAHLSAADPAGAIAARTLVLTLERSVEEGIRETLEIANFGLIDAHFLLELELASDFADLFEVKTGDWHVRESIETTWHPDDGRLVTAYSNRDFHRRFTYEADALDLAARFANGRLRFAIHLGPGAHWRMRGRMLLEHDGQERRPDRVHQSGRHANRAETDRHERWLNICTVLRTPASDVEQTYAESVQDMGALRLFERDLGPDVWVPSAGVPWFVTLFGRDSLIATLQNLIVYAPFAEGTLRTLAEYQATERDDWRDAQPGKIVHEVRHGELAHFNLVPHTRYYGTWDATPLYLMALAEAWRWLGDRQLIEDLRQTALRCLTWIDQFGDLDGDGFQEYQTYSPKGYPNMSWKDAEDAVVYPDGTQVAQPKALCELQGYVYAAKRGMAEVFRALGEHDRADALADEATGLKRRFNEAFWMEEEGTFAFGLDPKKQQIKTVTSNPGHCLWTGIVDEDKAGRLVERLLQPDMWSGWGVRTLSANNPAYNPLSYQRGSVWPHDNAIVAAGMRRYGYRVQANQVARGIFDAAAGFESYRLPEVFAGLERQEESFPVQYLGANIPQAWAAGSVFQLIQMMLGLDADVPNGRLWIDPALPDWMPSLDLRGLKPGRTTLDLRFWHEQGSTRFEVTSQRGSRLDVRAGQRPACAEEATGPTSDERQGIDTHEQH